MSLSRFKTFRLVILKLFEMMIDRVERGVREAVVLWASEWARKWNSSLSFLKLYKPQCFKIVLYQILLKLILDYFSKNNLEY